MLFQLYFWVPEDKGLVFPSWAFLNSHRMCSALDSGQREEKMGKPQSLLSRVSDRLYCKRQD